MEGDDEWEDHLIVSYTPPQGCEMTMAELEEHLGSRHIKWEISQRVVPQDLQPPRPVVPKSGGRKGKKPTLLPTLKRKEELRLSHPSDSSDEEVPSTAKGKGSKGNNHKGKGGKDKNPKDTKSVESAVSRKPKTDIPTVRVASVCNNGRRLPLQAPAVFAATVTADPRLFSLLGLLPREDPADRLACLRNTSSGIFAAAGRRAFVYKDLKWRPVGPSCKGVVFDIIQASDLFFVCPCDQPINVVHKDKLIYQTKHPFWGEEARHAKTYRHKIYYLSTSYSLMELATANHKFDERPIADSQVSDFDISSTGKLVTLSVSGLLTLHNLEDSKEVSNVKVQNESRKCAFPLVSFSKPSFRRPLLLVASSFSRSQESSSVYLFSSDKLEEQTGVLQITGPDSRLQRVIWLTTSSPSNPQLVLLQGTHTVWTAALTTHGLQQHSGALDLGAALGLGAVGVLVGTKDRLWVCGHDWTCRRDVAALLRLRW